MQGEDSEGTTPLYTSNDNDDDLGTWRAERCCRVCIYDGVRVDRGTLAGKVKGVDSGEVWAGQARVVVVELRPSAAVILGRQITLSTRSDVVA